MILQKMQAADMIGGVGCELCRLVCRVREVSQCLLSRSTEGKDPSTTRPNADRRGDDCGVEL